MAQGWSGRAVGRVPMSVAGVALTAAFVSAAPHHAVGTAAHAPAHSQWPPALSPEELAGIWAMPLPQQPVAYGALSSTGVATTGTQAAPATVVTTPAAAVVNRAISFARQQLGLPYQWGGNGPQRGDAGFDCSGLTQSAYAAAGLALPRTAQTEYVAGPHVPPGVDLQAGDLVFYGRPGHVHHVGLYLGRQVMIHAPTFGQPVQVSRYRWSGDDYVGATRPTAGLGGLGSYLPELPLRLPAGFIAGLSPNGGPRPGSGAASTPGASPGPTTRAAAPAPGPGSTHNPAPGPTRSPPPPASIVLPPLPIGLPVPTLPPLPPVLRPPVLAP